MPSGLSVGVEGNGTSIVPERANVGVRYCACWSSEA